MGRHPPNNPLSYNPLGMASSRPRHPAFFDDEFIEAKEMKDSGVNLVNFRDVTSAAASPSGTNQPR
jgi:hypothetical protein